MGAKILENNFSHNIYRYLLISVFFLGASVSVYGLFGFSVVFFYAQLLLVTCFFAKKGQVPQTVLGFFSLKSWRTAIFI